MKNLKEFRGNVYSQNGEDTVIQEILNRLLITESGTFCEFGAWDGKHLSNTYLLLESFGWRGVYIEGDPDKFKDLVKLEEKYKDQLICVNKFVSHIGDDTLDVILESTEIENDFDLLSIDIDSFDYQVWESLKNYSPKIVIIEVNSGAGPDKKQIHTVNETGDIVEQGSSYASTLELGNKKGYTCIYHHGNMIFLRNDLFDDEKFEHGIFDW
jgi:hypothetical protein